MLVKTAIAAIANIELMIQICVAAFNTTYITTPMTQPDFATFEAEAHARGFSEVLVRRWEPNSRPGSHSHSFDADALVVEGEMWLSTDGHTRHLLPGDTFILPAGSPHDEWYGPNGAVYWVARRDPG